MKRYLAATIPIESFVLILLLVLVVGLRRESLVTEAQQV
jgi:hypothetical protein